VERCPQYILYCFSVVIDLDLWFFALVRKSKRVKVCSYFNVLLTYECAPPKTPLMGSTIVQHAAPSNHLGAVLQVERHALLAVARAAKVRGGKRDAVYDRAAGAGSATGK
jgi:hypothetical protein